MLTVAELYPLELELQGKRQWILSAREKNKIKYAKALLNFLELMCMLWVCVYACRSKAQYLVERKQKSMKWLLWLCVFKTVVRSLVLMMLLPTRWHRAAVESLQLLHADPVALAYTPSIFTSTDKTHKFKK